jgi:UDP-glucose 4-epimerase
MARSSTRRLVFCSSFSVYDWSAIEGTLDEDSPLESAPDLYERDGYAIAKSWQERVTREGAARHGWELVVLRPGWIWGREHGYLYGLGQQLGSVHLVFGPNARLPLTHVENCADLFATCVDAPAASGRTYNVVDDDEVHIWRYLGDHLRLSRQGGLRIPIPYALGLGTARLAQATSRWIFRGKGKLLGAAMSLRGRLPLRFPSERARRELGWRPPSQDLPRANLRTASPLLRRGPSSRSRRTAR